MTSDENAAEFLRRELPGFQMHADSGTDSIRGRLLLGFTITFDALTENTAAMRVEAVRREGVAALGLEPMMREELQRARHEASVEAFADGKKAGIAEGRREMLAEVLAAREANAAALGDAAAVVGHPADAVAQCDRCGRFSWADNSPGAFDTMTQPSGEPCGGTFRAVARG